MYVKIFIRCYCRYCLINYTAISLFIHNNTFMHIREYMCICICVNYLYYFAYKFKKRFIIAMVDAVIHRTVPFRNQRLLLPHDGSVAKMTHDPQLLVVLVDSDEENNIQSQASFLGPYMLQVITTKIKKLNPKSEQTYSPPSEQHLSFSDVNSKN